MEACQQFCMKNLESATDRERKKKTNYIILTLFSKKARPGWMMDSMVRSKWGEGVSQQ